MIVDVITPEGVPMQINLHENLELVYYAKTGVLQVQLAGTQVKFLARQHKKVKNNLMIVDGLKDYVAKQGM